MIKLYVLDKNERLNLDNNKWTFTEISKKLREESFELREALVGYNQEHIAEEALDTIQVLAGLLDKLSNENMDLKKEIKIHNAKLKGRGWEVKKILEVRQI
jgi:NTP pyrophosphatase (non-canonical NTP hydrolase)